MLHSKGIESIQELKKFFAIPEKKVDYLLDSLKFFDLKCVNKRLDCLKRQGSSISSILAVLLILPFLNHATVHALLRSGSKTMANGGKDVYYRTSKRQDIDWRGVLTGFVKRFLTIIRKSGSVLGCGPKCLVVDDSLLQKSGLKGEFVGRLFDHVTHAYRIGLRLLQLCYYDGKSTIPIDFSIHREKGKVAEKPYGLTKKQLKNQHKTKRKMNSISWLRAKEVDESKMDIAIKMIKRSLKFLEVDYVLMDSWFTSKRMVECVRGAIDSNKKPKAHLIGMMKMGNASFIYNGELFTNCQSLLTKLKRTIKITKCKSMNSHYVIADVAYNGYSVRLFYSKFGQRGKWHLLLSTDQSLDYEEMMKIYKIRWTIEVYFHESKSLLGLGKCQSTSFEAQIASATLAMIQYILLTLKKRFDDYETRGAVFRDIGEEMQERKLHVRLWDFFLMTVNMVLESLDVCIENIDNYIKKLLRQNNITCMQDLLRAANQRE